MGLDMYLSRNIHIANYEHDVQGQAMSAAIFDALNVKHPEQYANDSLNVKLPAGYWRKANQIPAWFVENVQGGDDNCGDYYVSKEQLQELRAICQEVLADHSKAEALLPVQQGFFFGGDTYEAWYFQDLEETLEILDRALDPANAVTKYDSFYYHSSW